MQQWVTLHWPWQSCQSSCCLAAGGCRCLALAVSGCPRPPPPNPHTNLCDEPHLGWHKGILVVQLYVDIKHAAIKWSVTWACRGAAAEAVGAAGPSRSGQRPRQWACLQAPPASLESAVHWRQIMRTGPDAEARRRPGKEPQQAVGRLTLQAADQLLYRVALHLDGHPASLVALNITYLLLRQEGREGVSRTDCA